MDASIVVELRRNDGTTISRRVSLSSTSYPKAESMAHFKQRARKQASGAINSVFGTAPDTEITRG